MSRKHLDLTDRCIIEKQLALEHSFREIAASLNCSPSTVMREVRNNRVFITSSKTKGANFGECLKQKICGNSTCFNPNKTCREYDCHAICKDFKPFHCSRLDTAPYVCNSCENRNFCSKEHAVYSAHKADAKSRERLSDTRRALHTPNEKIAELNDLITLLILNGSRLTISMPTIPVNLRCTKNALRLHRQVRFQRAKH